MSSATHTPDNGNGSQDGVHRNDMKSPLMGGFEAQNPLSADEDDLEEIMKTYGKNVGAGVGILQTVMFQGITKQGYLFKKSTGINKTWQRRYFFIKDAQMYYVHKHTELKPKSVPAEIDAVLVANMICCTVRIVSKTEFQVIAPGKRKGLHGGGLFSLQADSSSEAQAWIEIIRQEIEGSIIQSKLPGGLESAAEAQLEVETTDMNDRTSTYQYFNVDTETLNLLRAENPVCADCGSASPEWASLNLCVLICIECGGVHRSLGSHISKVRSLTMDRWAQTAIDLLTLTGNDKCNSVWEATLQSHAFAAAAPEADLLEMNLPKQTGQELIDAEVIVRPDQEISQHRRTAELKLSANASRSDRERFIRDKYVTKRYLALQGATQAKKDALLTSATQQGDALGIMRALAAGGRVESKMEVPRAKTTGVNVMSALGDLLDMSPYSSTSADISIADGLHTETAGLSRTSSDNLTNSNMKVGVGVGPPTILQTPLQFASSNNMLTIVELLCLWGAAVESRDSVGRSAADLAEETDNIEILDVLTHYTNMRQS
jgi:hypothetical protein